MPSPIAAVLASEIARGARDRVFPGAAGAVVTRAGDLVVTAGGVETYAATAPPIGEGALFDLASVTKAVFAVAALRLVARKVVSLDAPVRSIVPAFRGPATLADLLGHRAGLPAWAELYREVPAAEVGTVAARDRIRRLSAEHARAPATDAVYSDLGFIVLGELLERAGGRPLADLLDAEILGPLGLSPDLGFRPPAGAQVVPTERCPWRGRVLRGEVQDENAFAMGGISAHAGLFATAGAVARFGRAMLDDVVSSAGRLLPPDLAAEMVRPRPGGTWRLGWDGKSATGSSAGRLLSARSFGHLGYTGCSLWIDPDARVVVVLLTNRVHPTRDNDRIKIFRPAFHDAVARALLG